MRRSALAALLSIALGGLVAASTAGELRAGSRAPAPRLAAASAVEAPRSVLPGDAARSASAGAGGEAMPLGAWPAGSAWGVTAIKRVVNQSPLKAVIRNKENPNKRLNGADVSPGTPAHRVDMWIPWARTSGEFRYHHITVVLEDGTGRVVRRFVIWQRADFDGDFVRFAEIPAGDPTVLGYAEPGARIPGISEVDGDRTLIVASDGSISLAAF